MSSTYRFRTILEMANDVVDTLENLAQFEEVKVFDHTKGKRLVEFAELMTNPPSAIVVPGPGDYPESGARNSRRVGFVLLIINNFDAGGDDEFEGMADLADAVIAAFLPAAAAPATPMSINGVQYEVTGHEPIDLVDGCDCYRVDILSFDYRQSRSDGDEEPTP